MGNEEEWKIGSLAQITGVKAGTIRVSVEGWHQYLHGSDKGRVREIYEKMVTDSDGIW